MQIHSELLDHRFELAGRPQRVVCLTSGLTEALFEMGCGGQVAGVSTYCKRYVAGLELPVAGDYLCMDEAVLEALNPDLILVTSGVQLPLGRRLARAGRPVYALPLPNSLAGILENIVTAASLLDALAAGRRLADRMASQAEALRAARPRERPSVYVELWFGRHLRTIGGRTFIHDLVTLAGGEPLYGDSSAGYLDPPLAEIARLRPRVVLGFAEPEYPVDFRALLAERGWDRAFAPVRVTSTIERGRNVIHDGPSLLETAEWLRGRLQNCPAGP